MLVLCLVAASCGQGEGVQTARAPATSTSSSTTTIGDSTTTTTPPEATTSTTSAPADTTPPTAATAAPATIPSTTTTTERPAPPTVGTWREIPVAPGQASGAVVWTDRELVAWSGRQTSGDYASGGVAYSPSTDEWRTFDHGPLSPRRSHESVWTGKEIIYWGGYAGTSNTAQADGAAFDPSTNQWRRIADAPMARGGAHAVWTGTEMVVWGGSDRCCPIDSQPNSPTAAAYDPVANAWRQLPDVTVSGDGSPAFTFAVGGTVAIFRAGHVVVLEPGASSWRELPWQPIPDSQCSSVGGPAGRYAATRSGRLFSWIGRCRVENGGFLDVPDGGEWIHLGAPPADLASVVAAGERLFALTGSPTSSIRELDVADRVWRGPNEMPRPGASFPVAAWTGSEVVLWEPSNGRGGLAFRPGN